MKILMAIDYYRPHVSGLTIYVEQLAEGLARRGHAVRVLAHRHRPDLPLESEENGVHVVRAPVAARVGKALVSPAILARALREIPRTEVLHLHAPLVNAVPLAFLGSTLRVPILVTFHCDLQPPPLFGQRFVEVLARASQHFALERASRVITYTEDYARNTRPLRDRLEKVGWILPPVADPPVTGRPAGEVRARLGVRGEPVILFLGRFAEEKGLPVLVRAFAEIRRRFPEAVLLLAGAKEVPGEAVLEKIAPLLADPASGVVAPGIVPPEEIADLFTIADVLVLPSINATESFGLVQVEAMLRGVPSVASNLPGVRQPVRLTGMGEIAPIGDATGLARQILKVLEAPASHRRPREEIRALFDPERTLRAYEAEYEAALGGSR
ncbi:MAG TPA: glycosyltransferase family 4 protein [Thermoanaerobaculia bacterium]|nr:glycosyltransferase family 4 protein [Thermoanaerobaculia bacterium]